MYTTNSFSTLLSVKHNLHLNIGSQVDRSLYRSLVGALQHLTLTHPNLSSAINLVCQFMQNPNIYHYQTMKRILHYLTGIVDFGLRIVAQSSSNLYGFLDTD